MTDNKHKRITMHYKCINQKTVLMYTTILTTIIRPSAVMTETMSKVLVMEKSNTLIIMR